MRIAVGGKDKFAVDALASLLSNEGRLDVVWKSTEPRELLAKAKDLVAWMIVLDVQDMDPKEIEFYMGARTIGDFGIVILADKKSISSFEASGADLVCSKADGAEELFNSIREAAPKFTRQIPGRVRDGRSKGYNAELNLTRREFEVATLIAKGHPNRRVSQVTGLKEQSVKNLVSVIMRKMGCDNRTQLALKVLGSRSYQSLG
ncbi:MAG: response regulator transcription factor [Armatimonadetes bacterium]|nr:response regulator transcription factor [Armatimonadota bacterium]